MVLRFIAFALVLLLLTPGSVLSAFEPSKTPQAAFVSKIPGGPAR